MSTAKSHEGDTEQPALTAADVADILISTLMLAQEAGLEVATKSRDAGFNREAGLLVFIPGLGLDADGRIVAREIQP